MRAEFHPEWGYLAPTPSFVHRARVVLVATAVGATVGAGVVFSRVSHTATETSVAAYIGWDHPNPSSPTPTP